MFTVVNTIFIDWLNNKLTEKGWTQADLSKRAQVSTAMISSVLSGRREPGINFCNSIASVLRVPPEDVYRLAGLLPSEPEPEDKTLYKIQNLYHTLREDSASCRLFYLSNLRPQRIQSLRYRLREYG